MPSFCCEPIALRLVSGRRPVLAQVQCYSLASVEGIARELPQMLYPSIHSLHIGVYRRGDICELCWISDYPTRHNFFHHHEHLRQIAAYLRFGNVRFVPMAVFLPGEERPLAIGIVEKQPARELSSLVSRLVSSLAPATAEINPVIEYFSSGYSRMHLLSLF